MCSLSTRERLGFLSDGGVRPVGNFYRRGSVIVIVVWVALGGGCAPASAPPSPAPPATMPGSLEPGQASGNAALSTSPKSADLDPTSTSRAGRELWDLCLVRSAKVGYIHTKFTDSFEDERPVRRGEFDQVLELERFGQTIRQQIWLVCWQTPSGDLVRFESRVTAGREATISKGQVEGDQLTIVTTTPGKTDTARIPWKPGVGGYFALEESLRAKPLKPGERRSLESLAPILHQVVRSDIKAVGYEAIKIGDQSEQLLKIQRTDRVGGLSLESTLWMNAAGDVLQQFMPVPAPGITYVRADRQAALSGERTGALDLGQSTVITLRNAPTDLAERSQGRFSAELASGSIQDLFESGIGQQVRITGERTAEIRVRAVQPDTKLTEAEQSVGSNPPPTAGDRQPNSLIQSDHDSVRKMADSVLKDEKDPWRIATALELLVHRRIQSKNFTQAFATAAEVAESGEGDCTEHAVLLAALCRARGIPARVTIGLLYVPSLQGLGYHMWNEVWIHNRWIPLDATLGRGGITASHVKLLTSNLDGYDAYAALLPVFRVLGQLQLTWLDDPQE